MTSRRVAGGPGDWPLWIVYGLCSLAAVLTGCWVVGESGGGSGPRILNLAAWGVGAGAAVLIARSGRAAGPLWLGLALAGLAGALLSPGLSGVHRWIGLGPMRLNSAELLAPLALVACAGLGARSPLRLLFPLAATILLALQPDVSQATAVAVAAVILLATSGQPLTRRIAAALGLTAAVLVAALRPDPLAPVPTVEGVIGLAAATTPLLAVLAMATLAAAALSPLVLARSSTVRDAALSLALYFAVSALAPAAGAYPVPLVGMGVSPILGGWLGVGWLMRLARRSSSHLA